MLCWGLPVGMVFNQPDFCMPDKGESRKQHIRWRAHRTGFRFYSLWQDDNEDDDG